LIRRAAAGLIPLERLHAIPLPADIDARPPLPSAFHLDGPLSNIRPRQLLPAPVHVSLSETLAKQFCWFAFCLRRRRLLLFKEGGGSVATGNV